MLFGLFFSGLYKFLLLLHSELIELLSVNVNVLLGYHHVHTSSPYRLLADIRCYPSVLQQGFSRLSEERLFLEALHQEVLAQRRNSVRKGRKVILHDLE